uniref:TRAPP14 N-terminal domain-containing protein n=1 Tax=Pseudonaja textilis TaxID=8673 RepID=A0A670ZNH8_PSETE
MESQCDYFMYFPAVPFPAREVLLGEPGRYRALPRRNHLYLGETVRFLLVLRCRSDAGGAPRPPWGELAGSLSALASVSPAGGGGGGGGGGDRDRGGGGGGGGGARCAPRSVLTPGSLLQVPPEEPIVSTDEVIFPLTISLDRLPPSTVKAKVSPRLALPPPARALRAGWSEAASPADRGDRLEARPRERRGPRARLPQHPAGPGPFPDLPRGAGRLQGAR